MDEKKIHDFHHVPGDKFSTASHAQPKTGIWGGLRLARLSSFAGESRPGIHAGFFARFALAKQNVSSRNFSIL